MQLLRRMGPHTNSHRQSGQAVVILALGFIGLLAFVGLVTDVSIMLVRHNQLVRAVDSAALNAANQMRSDRSFAQVGVAARMMIEMHGFDSEEILVQTCASVGEDENDDLCSERNRFRKLVRVGARVESPTVFLRLIGVANVELSAVSTSETAVLDVVMMLDVSESMLLDTSYQDWANIGYGRVYVPPVLDRIYEREEALSPDRFESRPASDLFPNAHNDPEIMPDGTQGDNLLNILQFWGADILGEVNGTNRVYPDHVNARLYYPNDGEPDLLGTGDERQFYRVQSFDYPGYSGQQSPREGCRVRFWPYSIRRTIDNELRNIPTFANLWEGGSVNLPSSTWGGFIPTYDFYGCCNDPTSDGRFVYTTGGSTSGTWDPNGGTNVGDNRFTDLICQPFKQARDATRAFLQTMDFERGDRVAFVTFDRGAFLVDPDGALGADDPSSLGSCPRDPDPVGGRTAFTHMMSSFCRAEATLMNHIGVRAEPNFYDWKEDGGGWRAFADGLTLTGDSNPVDYYRDPPDVPSSDEYVDADRAFNQYPVNNNCPMFDAAIPSFASRYSLWDWDWDFRNYGNNGGELIDLLESQPGPGISRIMTPLPGTAGWPTNLSADSSYELRASCRGTNVGAGLRESNNALLDPVTTRRSGAVWVIIMLGDGAAGASDPVRSNGRKLQETDPFRDYGLDPDLWPTLADGTRIRYGIRGEYGAFGLCPIGVNTPDGAGELMDQSENPPRFPYCSDEEPHTRNFCTPPGGSFDSVGIQCIGEGASQRRAGFAPGSKDDDYVCFNDVGTPSDLIPGDGETEYNVRNGNIYDVDIGQVTDGLIAGAAADANCDPLYDVDDYARDWADFVGLSRDEGSVEQLPTIFTIGFGLDFSNNPRGEGLPGSAQDNNEDFLGEELLRYIADVGDNAQIDTDYQQDLRQDGELNGFMSDTDDEVFGPRGPCEDPAVTPNDSGVYLGAGNYGELVQNGYSTADGGTGTMIRPLPPTQDCGNYYNAPDQARLRVVFDDIASRMFTRLAP